MDIKQIKTNINNQFKKFRSMLSIPKAGETAEDKLSKLNTNIAKFANASRREIFHDLVRSLYKRPNSDEVNIQELIKDFGLQAGVERDRLTRYLEYEEIVEKISYAKRALKVITDNIISPDDYYFDSIKIVNKKNRNDVDYNEIIKTYERINEVLGIDEKLYEIIETTLWFGDYFCEIVLISEELKKHGLLEHNNYIQTEKFNVGIQFEDNNPDKKESIFNISVEYVQPNRLLAIKEEDSKNSENKIENINNLLSNIYLKFYRPHQVVRVGENPCLGFLVFPDMATFYNPRVRNSQISAESAKKLLNKILAKIKNGNKQEAERYLLNQPELQKILTLLLLQQQTGQSITSASPTARIRFVPYENMIHFRIDSIKNAPYGKSIFFGQEFLAKILIMIQTTIAIHRITNSGEKRIIAVEIGLPRDARQIVQELKSQFKRKRYSVDNIGTIKDVPSAITTFEDIYLPMKDGKRFVEFDSISTAKNIGERVEDLQAIRDHFIAGLEVPPAFLSVEENLESKCLALDTKIPLLDGRTLTLEEIISEIEQGKTLHTYSYNHDTGEIIGNKIIDAKVTRKKAQVIKVILDNNKEIVCTPDHKFLLRDGNYIEAQYLQSGDPVMSYHEKDPKVLLLNHKVKEIIWLEERIDTGDIQVENYSNFALDAGIIVHNSTLTQQNILFTRSIVAYQKIFSKYFTELFSRIYKIIHKKPEMYHLLSDIIISFSRPKSLKLELDAEYYQNLSNLIDTLKNLGISKDYIVKRFLKEDINESDLEQLEVDEKIDSLLSNEEEEGGQF